MADVAEQPQKTSAAEYAEMLKVAATKSPLIAKAIADMDGRRKAIVAEQQALLRANAEKWQERGSGKSEDFSGDGLAKQVRAAAQQDKQYFAEFTAMLKTLPPDTHAKVPFAVRFHKMDLVIDGTSTDIFKERDETNIVRLASGELPLYWTQNYNPNLPPIIGGDDAFWGTSRVTCLSYAARAINFALTNRTINHVDLNSVTTHVAPLPAGVKLHPACSWAYSTKAELDGFGYVHSGYSFGGHRFEEVLYPRGKTWGPEDCSSWVAKITGCRTLFSTSDQRCTYIAATKGAVSEPWLKSRDAQDMLPMYHAVEIADAQAGDIYVSRTFAHDQDHMQALGNGGHTALIFSINPKTKMAATLGFNRDMPGKEGFGIQEFSLEATKTAANLKMPFILRPKI